MFVLTWRYRDDCANLLPSDMSTPVLGVFRTLEGAKSAAERDALEEWAERCTGKVLPAHMLGWEIVDDTPQMDVEDLSIVYIITEHEPQD